MNTAQNYNGLQEFMNSRKLTMTQEFKRVKDAAEIDNCRDVSKLQELLKVALVEIMQLRNVQAYAIKKYMP